MQFKENVGVVDESGKVITGFEDGVPVINLTWLRKAVVRFEMVGGIVDWVESMVPAPNCSCHVNAPCWDCVQYGEVRELIAEIRRLL